MSDLDSFLGRLVPPPAHFLDPAFPQQSAFISDPSRLKAVLCTRRAGKSYGLARYLLKVAAENRESHCLYLGLTRISAQNVMWGLLKRLARKFGLRATYNETGLTCTLANESVIRLAGADASPEEAEKFLGVPYRLAVIDEAASFRQDLWLMVESVLRPAMIDYQGTIVLAGTPGNYLGQSKTDATGKSKRGLFYEATRDGSTEREWSVHKWSALDNPYIKTAFASEIASIKREKPLFLETPAFKQQYLGLWCIDDNKLCYDFDPLTNTYDQLPTGEYSYVLGVDLGYNDATTFTVGAYSRTDDCLYVPYAFAKSGMDITAVAEFIKTLEKRYSFDKMIVDGASKQSVQEMVKRHNLPLQAAEKKSKMEFIEILNSDFLCGKIKLQRDATRTLQDELQALIFDPKSMGVNATRTLREHPGCLNNQCDSLLYAWRYCFNYLAIKKPSGPTAGSAEYYDQMAADLEAAAEARWREAQEPKKGLDDWTW